MTRRRHRADPDAEEYGAARDETDPPTVPASGSAAVTGYHPDRDGGAPAGSAHPSDGVPAELIDRVRRRLAPTRQAPTPDTLAAAVRAEAAGVLDDARVLAIMRHVEHELSGAGPLTPLLADPATTDVVVNSPHDVRVDRGRGWERVEVDLPDEPAVQRLARRLASLAGRRLDDAHPFVDGQLADGTRLHAVLPPLAADGTCLSLRVLQPARYDLDALHHAGLTTPAVHRILAAVVAARLAFVVSGGTGSGKTTLLGALLGEVAAHERIVTVEDAEELRPTHPHVVRLVARAANVEGSGAIGLREMVRQALRMRPDRIVVGEVRGGEVVELIAALSTGHDGGAGTVHANGAADVPERLVALAAQHGVDAAAFRARLGGAIQVVIHLRRVGSIRQVGEIAVLETHPDHGIRVQPIAVDGELCPAGAGHLARMLQDRGVDPPW